MTDAHFAALAPTGSCHERKSASGIRSRLRVATAAAHERMHGHPGFAAAAAGAIRLSDYRRLLARIFGFHKPFEVVASEAAVTAGVEIDIHERARSPALLSDLKALGLDEDAIARLPLWAAPHRIDSEGSLLGALYVLEGSTLGGIQIARALRGQIGDETGDGRRFFLGRGDQQGAMWGDFVERLETLSESPEQATQAIEAAVITFQEFEAWMAGWRAESGPPA
jgi:heme oxygenase (biliverdin-IX-beta and delta-forming)